MDRSEGAKPKGSEAGLFQVRDEGKPRVANRRGVTRSAEPSPHPPQWAHWGTFTQRGKAFEAAQRKREKADRCVSVCGDDL